MVKGLVFRGTTVVRSRFLREARSKKFDLDDLKPFGYKNEKGYETNPCSRNSTPANVTLFSHLENLKEDTTDPTS